MKATDYLAPPSYEDEKFEFSRYQIKVADVITKCWKENGLKSFYSKAHLDRIIKKAQKMSPLELKAISDVAEDKLIDAFQLILYDSIILIDDSGSMNSSNNKESLFKFLEVLSPIIAAFDDNGISIRFLNNKDTYDGLKDYKDVKEKIDNILLAGQTPLGEVLTKKILKPFVYNFIDSWCVRLQKPVMIYVFTDGVPDSEEEVYKSMRKLKKKITKSRYGSGACKIMYIQVGNDQKASTFLNDLDNREEFDRMIDCTATFEIERVKSKKDLTHSLWLLKAVLGGISHFYDNLN